MCAVFLSLAVIVCYVYSIELISVCLCIICQSCAREYERRIPPAIYLSMLNKIVWNAAYASALGSHHLVYFILLFRSHECDKDNNILFLMGS